MFCDATMRLGHTSVVLPWTQVLADPQLVCRSIQGGDIIRIESPGENSAVERTLIEMGAEVRGHQRCSGTAQAVGADAAESCCLSDGLGRAAATGCGRRQASAHSQDSVSYGGEFGRIEDSSLWYAGFCSTLKLLQTSCGGAKSVRWMNAPQDIALMFDKAECQAMFQSAGIPVPQILGSVSSYEELRLLMRQKNVARVFLKLPHSSSASGIIALQTNGRQVIAQTSAELVQRGTESILYNSLQVRRYTDERQVALLVDTLGAMGLHVEQWMPKAGLAGRSFDLRVVVIAGNVRHVVVRTSRTPMTNLHLGNERGDVDRVRRAMPAKQWGQAMQACEDAAKCLPESLYMGVDLLFTPGFRTHSIMEVNAFGDLLPNVVHGAETTYEAEVAAAAAQQESQAGSGSDLPGRSA